MSQPIGPLSVTLIVGDQRFIADSFSESGLALPGAANGAFGVPTRSSQRRRAVLRLDADGHSDEYDVEVRVATCSPECVEVSLAELPPQARLRLRHARDWDSPIRRDANPAGTSAQDSVRSSEEAAARRLILSESLGVLNVTNGRRGEDIWHCAAPILEAHVMTRAYLNRALAALAATTLVLIVMAIVLILS